MKTRDMHSDLAMPKPGRQGPDTGDTARQPPPEEADMSRFRQALGGEPQPEGHGDEPQAPRVNESKEPSRRAPTPPNAQAHDGADGRHGHPDHASHESREGDHKGGDSGSESRDGQRAPGIFGLFGGPPADMMPPPTVPVASPVPQAAALAPAMPSTRTDDVVAAMTDRVLVSCDGAREIRVSLKPDVLPGVEFSVKQEGGRWVVDFDVSHALSLALLQGAGERMAGELSQRLNRGVELRMSGTQGAEGDLEQPYLFSREPSPESAWAN